MRIITKRTLREFYQKHPDAKTHLDTWYDLVKKAQWNSWTDIKKLYPKSSPVKNNRVVFDIAGNKYRLIAKIEYHTQEVYIRFIGTHNEYNKIKAGDI